MDLNYFKSKEFKAHRAAVEKELAESKQRREEDSRMWSAYMNNFQYAEKAYKDGKTEKAIAVYEQTIQEMLKYGTRRLNLQACRDLIKIYIKEKRMNDAWRITNLMYVRLIQEDGTVAYANVIRYEQFKILKKEKRYIDALSSLFSSWVLYGWACKRTQIDTFDPQYMIKEGTTTAKGVGLTPEQYQELIMLIRSFALSRPDDERGVSDLYLNYLRSKGLLK